MLALEKTTQQLRKGWHYIGYACGLDIAFLIFYGFITGAIIDPASFALSQVVATSGETVELSVLVSHPAFITFAAWLALQVLSMYFLFSLFEGSSCYMTHRALARKVNYQAYMKRFLKATIPWLVLFVFYQVFALVRDYTVLQGGEVIGANLFLDLYLIVIVFLAGLHFNIIVKKATFIDVFSKLKKDQKKLLPVALILILLTFVLELVVRLLPAGGILSFTPYVLVMVYFAWARGVWLAQ